MAVKCLNFSANFDIIIHMRVIRKFIDWEATGNKLYRLRSDNANLRRFVCSAIRKGSDMCANYSDCENCSDRYMDHNISRPEIAAVFGVSDSVINNWERGKTAVGVENLLFYCQMAEVTLDDILVFQK